MYTENALREGHRTFAGYPEPSHSFKSPPRSAEPATGL